MRARRLGPAAAGAQRRSRSPAAATGSCTPPSTGSGRTRRSPRPSSPCRLRLRARRSALESGSAATVGAACWSSPWRCSRSARSRRCSRSATSTTPTRTWRTDLERAYDDLDRAAQLNRLSDLPLLAEGVDRPRRRRSRAGARRLPRGGRAAARGVGDALPARPAAGAQRPARPRATRSGSRSSSTRSRAAVRRSPSASASTRARPRATTGRESLGARSARAAARARPPARGSGRRASPSRCERGSGRSPARASSRAAIWPSVAPSASSASTSRSRAVGSRGGRRPARTGARGSPTRRRRPLRRDRVERDQVTGGKDLRGHRRGRPRPRVAGASSANGPGVAAAAAQRRPDGGEALSRLGLEQALDRAADDLGAGGAEQPAGAEARLDADAVVVDDQHRLRAPRDPVRADLRPGERLSHSLPRRAGTARPARAGRGGRRGRPPLRSRPGSGRPRASSGA